MNYNFNLSQASNLSDNNTTTNNSFGEKEVKDWLIMYNSSLWKIRDEIDSYKSNQSSINEHMNDQRNQFKQEIKKIKKQVNKVRKVKEEFDLQTGILETQLNKDKSIKETIDFIERDSTQSGYFIEFLSCFEKSINSLQSVSPQLFKDFTYLKKDLISLYNEKDQTINSLKINKNKLIEINTILKEKVRIIEEENNRLKLCVHCHTKFSPKDNNENNCVYHPGSMKYYSCRGCGGDEYYTCCLKCQRCSSGCKKSKHVSEMA